MESFDFPKRNRDETHQIDVALLEVLESLLADDEGITLRTIVRRLDGIGQPSSISRDSWRSQVVKTYQARQRELRRLIERADKSSKSNLVGQLQKSKSRIAELEATVEMLTASHKALILAVGQVGGMSAWKAFYERYEAVIDDIRRLGALPTAEVVLLRNKD